MSYKRARKKVDHSRFDPPARMSTIFFGEADSTRVQGSSRKAEDAEERFKKMSIPGGQIVWRGKCSRSVSSTNSTTVVEDWATADPPTSKHRKRLGVAAEIKMNAGERG